jgi:hypothetical protein
VFLIRNKGTGIGKLRSFFLVSPCSLFLIISISILGWMLLAGLAGGVGLLLIADQTLSVDVCLVFGCHFGGNFWWFVLTDVSMYCVYRYWLTRVPSSTKRTQGRHPEAV